MKSFLLFQYYKLLRYFARKYIKKWQPLVIGINGSVGKTSCRMITHQVLENHLGERLTLSTSPNNFNGELGMSLSIFQIESWTPSIAGMRNTIQIMRKKLQSTTKPYDVLILEYGIDRPKEMDFLCSIVKPHISILTKLDAVHSLQFGDAQAIAQEELKLQQNTLLKCYINNGEAQGMNLAKALSTKISIYDTINKEADIYSDNYRIHNNTDGKSSNPLSSQSTLHVRNKEITFSTNIIGKIHHDYIALAYDLVETLRNQYNFPSIDDKKNLDLTLQPGRFSVFEGIYKSILIDSSYNSSPLSLRKSLQESNNLHAKLYPDFSRVYILGDMRELGDSETTHHRELAEYLKTFLTAGDSVLLLGQAMKTTYEELQDLGIAHLIHSHNIQETGIQAKKLLQQFSHNKQQAFVFIKGSQNTIFLEEVVKSLLKNSSDHKRLTRQSDQRLQKKDIV